MAQAPDDQKIEISQDEQKAIFDDLKKKPFSSQGVFFLNIFWSKYENDKDSIFTLFAAFYEQNQKHGAKENCLQYPSFLKILQASQDERVKEAKVDKPSLSKAFQELGLKLGGDVTLIEALLFLFKENVKALVGSPTSPADAALRAAKANLEAEQKAERDLLVQKENLETEINSGNFKPLEVAKKRAELAKLDETINAGKVDRSKRIKAAQKKLAECESALVEENTKGTEATNWWKKQCEEQSISYSG